MWDTLYTVFGVLFVGALAAYVKLSLVHYQSIKHLLPQEKPAETVNKSKVKTSD